MENPQKQTDPKSVFRESVVSRFSAPEDMKQAIKVTGPRVWLALLACVFAVAGLLCWACFGAISITEQARGVAEGTSAVCFLDDASSVRAGMTARAGSLSGRVRSVSVTPVSRDELSEKYEDYVLYELNPAQYAYAVEIGLDGEARGVIDVSIELERVPPISFLIGREETK